MKHLIKRIYHPYWLWEETKTNMWNTPVDRDQEVLAAVQFMGNTAIFAAAMVDVVKQWKYSCEHNLTNLSQNRRAWLGWAACAFAVNISQEVVCLAWSQITEQQRIDANAAADRAISDWEMLNTGELCLNVD